MTFRPSSEIECPECGREGMEIVQFTVDFFQGGKRRFANGFEEYRCPGCYTTFSDEPQRKYNERLFDSTKKIYE